MKKSILALAMALTSAAAFAQEEKPSFIALNAGVSVPVGDFADTDPRSAEAGFASSGIAYSLEGAYFANKTFGIGAKVGGFNNPVDSDKMEEEYQGSSSTEYTIETDKFKSYQVMVGSYIHIPLNRFTLGFNGLAGLVTSKSPEITIIQHRVPVSISWGTQPELSASTFGFDLGTHLRYSTEGDNLGITLNANFIYVKHAFDDQGYRFIQPVSVVNLTAGLYVKLNP